VGSIFAACSLFGNLLGGTINDKFGTTKTTVIGFVLALVACLSLMLAPQIPALAYVYGVSKGVSVFAYILAPSMLVGALFGKKDFGAILGITQVFFALGFALGSFVFGVIVDKAGYMIAWSFILVAILVAYSMLLVAIKAMSKAKKENLANFDSNEMKKAN
ncbi:MAG: MFS transporter, partial [Romboutsia timonensis]